jgi:hypothetical protein
MRRRLSVRCKVLFSALLVELVLALAWAREVGFLNECLDDSRFAAFRFESADRLIDRFILPNNRRQHNTPLF